jgi:NADH-quinone oxidoreductase subunit E
MSARRIAAEQPESFAFNEKSEAKVAFWLAKYPEERKASAVIPLLWIAQKQDNWVSEPAMREIAARCGMPYIRVYEVATFYTMFNLEQTGKHLIQVCGTTPCWLRGADALKAVCEKKIGKKGREHVSSDGMLAWEEVECLGACANAPMVQISNTEGDLYYEDLTPEALEQMLDDLRAGKDVKAGPISGRSCSEPTQATVKTLVDESLYDGSRAKKITLPNTKGAEKAEAPKAEPAKPQEKAAESKAKPKAKAKSTAPKETAADAGAGEKPALLKKPKGEADDLKKLSGLGPKLEASLNEIGVYHYSQIASWTAEETAWVDSALKLRGRIERDNWIDQAKDLAGKAEG